MAESKTLHERLAEVQANLKAPKGQFNSFGGYKYRSCEDILESVKPLLKEQGLVLTLFDELESLGDRYYVKATAIVMMPVEGDQHARIHATAYAREEETKKGMDGSQITGTASSYARKYALNGLFLIDDTKDADTDEHYNQTTSSSSQPQQSTPTQPVNRTNRTFDEDGVYPCEAPGCSETQTGSFARTCHSKFGRVYCRTHWGMAKKGELDPKGMGEPESVVDAYGDNSGLPF